MLDRKPSMLYIMIVKPLVRCRDNFEQNAKMTSLGARNLMKMPSVMAFSFSAVELCFVTINKKS